MQINKPLENHKAFENHREDGIKLLYAMEFFTSFINGGRNSSVVFGLAVHSVAGSILLLGNFPVEGIFPLELTWVQTPFPQKLFRMRV